MRKKTEYKKISIPKEIHEKLKDDRNLFQLGIGGGRWSIGDVIKEYYKIMPREEAFFLVDGKQVTWSEVKENKEKWIPIIKNKFCKSRFN